MPGRAVKKGLARRTVQYGQRAEVGGGHRWEKALVTQHWQLCGAARRAGHGERADVDRGFSGCAPARRSHVQYKPASRSQDRLPIQRPPRCCATPPPLSPSGLQQQLCPHATGLPLEVSILSVYWYPAAVPHSIAHCTGQLSCTSVLSSISLGHTNLYLPSLLLDAAHAGLVRLKRRYSCRHLHQGPCHSVPPPSSPIRSAGSRLSPGSSLAVGLGLTITGE